MHIIEGYLEEAVNNQSTGLIMQAVMWALNIAVILAAPLLSLAEETSSKCYVKNSKGEEFDLSPLRLLTRNYVAIPEDADANMIHIVNVCGPLVASDDAECPRQAGSCMYHIDHPMISKDLGHYVQNDTASSNLTVLYTDGGVCDGRLPYKTLIKFRCDPQAGKGIPIAKPIDNTDCQQIYDWPTRYVCSKEEIDKHKSHRKPCLYVDSRNPNSVVDLSYFGKTTNHAYDIPSEQHEGYNYSINFCSPAIFNPGCLNAGACFNYTNHGKSRNMGLQRHHRTLYLTYYNGARCKDGGQELRDISETSDRWETRIDLVCDRSAGFGEPVLKEELECETRFEWRTARVCPTLTSTCQPGGWVDLRDLSRAEYDWSFTDRIDNRYKLNICGPLNILNGVDGDTMAYVRLHYTDRYYAVGKDWDQTYKRSPSSGLVMEYGQGHEYCMGKEKKSSIEISLQCHPVTQSPTFLSVGSRFENCITRVEWKTPLACDRKPIYASAVDNVIYDINDGWALNLTSLFTRNFRTRSLPFFYNFGLNGRREDCKGICLEDRYNNVSLLVGSLSKIKYLWRAPQFPLTLEMDSDTYCHGKPGVNHHVRITLLCSNGTGYLNSILYEYRSRYCGHLFQWTTPHVCMSNARNITPEEWEQFKMKPHPMKPSTSGTSTAWISTLCGLSAVLLCLAGVALYISTSQERRQSMTARFSKENEKEDNSALVFQNVLAEGN